MRPFLAILLAAVPATAQPGRTPSPQRSEEQIRAELATNRSNPADLHAELGRLLLSRNRLDEAAQSFETALRLDPLNAPAAYGLSAIAFRRNDLAKAEEYALLASGLKPLDAYYLTHLAKVRMALKKYDAAVQDLERAVTIKGGKQTAWQYSLLAQCRIAQGRYAEAAEYTLKQLESRPWDDTIYVDAARLYYKAGDTTMGNRYRRMAGHAWNEYDYLKGLQNPVAKAWGLFRAGQYAEAKDLFLESARRQDPPRANDLWAAGLCSLKMDQLDEAEDLFRQALRFDPKLCKALAGLANTAQARRDLKTARHLFQEALRCDPDDVWTWQDLAELETEAKNWQAALQACRQLTRLDPDNPYHWATTARTAEQAQDSWTAWEAWFQAFRHSRNRQAKKTNLRKAVEAGYAAASQRPDKARTIASTMLKYLPQDSADHAVYKRILETAP